MTARNPTLFVSVFCYSYISFLFKIINTYKSIMSSNTDLKKISNNYNQIKILNLIKIIHKKRVLIHIKKFIIWMI
jgi:hypothetical protein